MKTKTKVLELSKEDMNIINLLNQFGKKIIYASRDDEFITFLDKNKKRIAQFEAGSDLEAWVFCDMQRRQNYNIEKAMKDNEK